MKKIRIYFVDFWKGFNVNDNFFVNRLRLFYTVELDAFNPEYLFFSYNGVKNLQYKNSVKIYFSGENDVPNFNLCDYAIGFYHITFEDRYLRLPLFVIYECFSELDKPKNVTLTEIKNKKFCAFVVSNSKNADPYREFFFKKLNEYKKVDSGGRLLNHY